MTRHEMDLNGEKTSINGVVYSGYMTPYNFSDFAFVVYDTNKKGGKLTGVIGILDTDTGRKVGSYRILVDGELVAKGIVTPTTPKPLNVDLEGAKSLRIELTNCAFGDPKVSLAVSDSQEGVRLIAPEDDDPVSGGTALRWSAIDDAVSYGVEIACVSLGGDPDEGATRLWAYTVKGGRTSLSLEAGNLPAGRYSWRVVAFGKKKMLGSFSTERHFIVSR